MGTDASDGTRSARLLTGVNQMDKAYNTGKIMIGQYYQKPKQNHMNRDCDFWQSVLLGDYQREVIFRRQMVLYIIFLAVLFSTLAIVL
jgi:hypothetical protein